MAGKTLSDLTDELLREVVTLKAHLSSLEQQVDSADLLNIRERIPVLENAGSDLKKLVEEAGRRGERLAVIEAQFAELKKQFEEKDRRWWQFWVGVSAVVLTFAANLVINLLLFFARKPG